MPEWSQPQPGPYPGTMEITREGPWCNECNRQHIDRIMRRKEGEKLIYSRSVGPHWVGQFDSSEKAKDATETDQRR